MSRSNEQIKFKLSTGKKRSCTRHISVGVGGQQPARYCSCMRFSPPRVCKTAETKTCCSSAPAWPPAGTAHALHTLPCFSSQLCESAVSAKDADLLPSSEEMGLWHDLTQTERVPTREDAIWGGFQLFQRPGKGQGPLLSSSASKLEAEPPDQLHSVFEARETYRT